MGRKPIGDRAMTDAEKQQRQRDREKQKRALSKDVLNFLRWHDPKHPEWDQLSDLQRRIRTMFPDGYL